MQTQAFGVQQYKLVSILKLAMKSSHVSTGKFLRELSRHMLVLPHPNCYGHAVRCTVAHAKTVDQLRLQQPLQILHFAALRASL